MGATVTGLDLREPLTDKLVEELRNAFHTHCVLCFRGQTISKAQQVGFSRYFGDPVPHPTNTRDRDPEHPEVTIISNIQEAGKAIGALGNDEIRFHADLVFLHTPGSISLLYCVETPKQGGDTYWTNGYAGYHALNEETKAKIDGLSAVYVHAKPEYNPPVAPRHPLVCVHPETGRKTLFLSPNAAQSVEDRQGNSLDQVESSALLERLFAHATTEEFTWRHAWQPGDLIMWDNRCTMHRRDGFDASQRRFMWRTQMLGPCTA